MFWNHTDADVEICNGTGRVVKHNGSPLEIATMPHGIIVLSPLSSNPSPLSHNPSLQTTVGQVSRPVHPSAAQTMPEAWCGELRPANPSATPTTHGKLELYCQVFVSSRHAKKRIPGGTTPVCHAWSALRLGAV